jgi:hypothetical protein
VEGPVLFGRGIPGIRRTATSAASGSGLIKKC